MKEREARRVAWLVEKHGRTFARLEHARFFDMFWLRLEVIDLTLTDRDHNELVSKAFWHEGTLPVFRESRSGGVSPHAFAGGLIPTPDEPWILVRGLHMPRPAARPPWVTRAASWLRRRFLES